MKSFNLVLFTLSLILVCNAFKVKSRIMNGKAAAVSQFPYYAFLRTKDIEGNATICGSVLISSDCLITAAHCIDDALNLTVHFGATRLDKPAPAEWYVRVEKENFFVHPKYETNSILHDIGMLTLLRFICGQFLIQYSKYFSSALIHLPQRVKYSQCIKPVRLPTTCKSTDNLQAVIMGNGKNDTQFSLSPQLNFAFLKVLPKQMCFPQITRGPIFDFISKFLICAEHNVKEAVSFGDSGSPLVENDSNGTLIGIATFIHKSKCINYFLI